MDVFDRTADYDPNNNPIKDHTNIDNIYVFTDTNGNVAEKVGLGCFRPHEVTDPQSCYGYSPPPHPLPLCDVNSNPASNQCILGDAYASNPGWQSRRGMPAHSGSNVFGMGIPCFSCQYVLLDDGTFGRSAGKLYAAGATSEHLGACP